MTAQKKLEALMRRAKIPSQAVLATQICQPKYSHASGVQRFFNNWQDDYYPLAFVKRLSPLVGMGLPPITREEVAGLAESAMIPTEARHNTEHRQLGQSANRNFPMNLHDTVPLYGSAAGAGPGIVRLVEEHMIGEEPRHPAIYNVKNGFAMLVYGDSMAPRHRHGEKVYVHPYAIPAIGQDCIIVEEPDGNALVKEFRGDAGDDWKFAQLNPPKEFRLKKSKVRNIYAVVR